MDWSQPSCAFSSRHPSIVHSLSDVQSLHSKPRALRCSGPNLNICLWSENFLREIAKGNTFKNEKKIAISLGNKLQDKGMKEKKSQ